MDKKIQNERSSRKEKSCHQKPSNLIVAHTEYGSPIDGAKEESSEYLCTRVNIFKEKYEVFMIVYLEWKKARMETIKKLAVLQGDVHNDQLKFNKANAVFKNLSVSSRQLKINSESTPVSILSSFTTLVTDVVSGFTSVAQALNIDTYLKQFAEIMDKDMEMTQHLYNARSVYFEQYKDVEEVLRKYHSETFSSTVDHITSVLRTEKLWSDIKLKIEKDEIPRIFDSVKEFVNINVNNGAVEKVFNTFQDYAKKNPAALDACNSAGKVFYDIYDTFDLSSAKLINVTETSVGQRLLNGEITELSELRAVIENGDDSQARLESDIENAIIGLQREMEEVSNSLKELERI